MILTVLTICGHQSGHQNLIPKRKPREFDSENMKSQIIVFFEICCAQIFANEHLFTLVQPLHRLDAWRCIEQYRAMTEDDGQFIDK